MIENFQNIYNQSYANFYSTCKYKDLISNSPIPYILSKDAKTTGEYNNGMVIIKEDSINSSINAIKSTLYHEFTHYYDESVFKELKYSEKDIKVLMLTFSEIHASYNSIFAFLNFDNLSVYNRIKMDKVIYNGHKLSQLCNSQANDFISKMNGILGFKYSMYLLGERRAMLKISNNPLEVNRIYNNTRIPKLIRDEILSIDKLIILDKPENIDIPLLDTLKLKAETNLLKYSVNNLPPLPDIEGIDEIKDILNSLQN